MKFNKKFAVIIGFTIVCIFILFRLSVLGLSIANMFINYNRTEYHCNSNSFPFAPYEWDLAKTSYAVADISPSIESLNVLENIFSYGPIYLIDNDIFLVGNLEGRGDGELLSLDTQNGQVNWQMCETEAMIMDKDRIYVGYTDFSGAYVNAVDIQSGEKMWQTKVDHNGISTIQINFRDLLVTTNDHGDKRYYLVDRQTGKIHQTFRDYRVKDKYLVSAGYTIYEPTARGLAAIGNANWEIDLPNTFYQSEIKTTHIDHVLLIESNTNFISQIFAVDPSTGETLWQTEKNIKSNLVVEDGVVFFLTGESTLKAVDLFSGQSISEIQFSPSLTSLSDFDYVNSHPYIAVHNGKLAIYFDTGRQLFTFQFLR